MTIRLALPDDRYRVILLLKASHAAAGFNDPGGPTGFHCEFEAAYAEQLFNVHRMEPGRLCLVHAPDSVVQGVLMAAAYRHPFGDLTMAKETAWWIDPAHRGSAAMRMLEAYERWAFAEQGCAFAGMAGMGDDPAVAALYRRRGYRTAETHYLKTA